MISIVKENSSGFCNCKHSYFYVCCDMLMTRGNGSKHVVLWYNKGLCVTVYIFLFFLIVTPTGMNQFKIKQINTYAVIWYQKVTDHSRIMPCFIIGPTPESSIGQLSPKSGVWKSSNNSAPGDGHFVRRIPSYLVHNIVCQHSMERWWELCR